MRPRIRRAYARVAEGRHARVEEGRPVMKDERRGLFLFLAAVCVGWLAGLSETEISSTLLKSLAAAAVATGIAVVWFNIAELNGPKKASLGESWMTSMTPIAMFLLALGASIGYPLGLVAKNFGWFVQS